MVGVSSIIDEFIVDSRFILWFLFYIIEFMNLAILLKRVQHGHGNDYQIMIVITIIMLIKIYN